MPWDEDEYKEWQHRYEDIEEEWDEDWSNEKRRDHFENLRLHNEQYVCHSNLSSGALVRSVLVG